jgi:hypothetical protein
MRKHPNGSTIIGHDAAVVESMKKRCRHVSPPTPTVAFYPGLIRLHIPNSV